MKKNTYCNVKTIDILPSMVLFCRYLLTIRIHPIVASKLSVMVTEIMIALDCLSDPVTEQNIYKDLSKPKPR